MEKKSFFKRKGWKIIFRYLFKYKGEIVLLSILGMISAVANGTVPYIMGKFFDGLISFSNIVIFGSQFPMWFVLLTIWIFAQILANSMDWIINVKSRKIGTLMSVEYKSEAFSKLLNLPLSFHKDKKVGEITESINRASNDIGAVIENVFIGSAPQFLSIIIGIGIAFYINLVLASFLIIGIGLYVLTLAKIAPPLAKARVIAHNAYVEAWSGSYSAYANVQTVKRFTAEEYEKDRIANSWTKEIFGLFYKLEKSWSAISFFQRIIIVGTQLAIFIGAIYFIQIGSLTIGDLIALNAYAAIVFGPFMVMGTYWEMLDGALVASEKAEIIFEADDENYNPKGSIQLTKVKGEIEFQNVSFSYDEEGPEVLKGINFKVKAGETVALVGKSGVGKSTTIDLLAGYYFPTKGKILIDGNDVTNINLTNLRKNIATVPQEITLFNDTIENNIKYGSFKATQKEVLEVAKQSHSDIFIETFKDKYKQVVGERGVKLSVGQKQRIAIARAMLRNPSIFILDEPTSALDIETEKFITTALNELMEGRTTFIIAHRLSTVREADKILVFQEGKIIEEGKHEELIKIDGGVYQNLYNLHIGLS